MKFLSGVYCPASPCFSHLPSPTDALLLRFNLALTTQFAKRLGHIDLNPIGRQGLKSTRTMGQPNDSLLSTLHTDKSSQSVQRPQPRLIIENQHSNRYPNILGSTTEDDSHHHQGHATDNRADADVDTAAYADAEPEENSDCSAAGKPRVIMMHDENGKNKPIYMNQVYYDTVRPDADKAATLPNSCPSPLSQEPKRPDPSRIRKPTPQRAVRGVELSSSEEEETSPNNQSSALQSDTIDEFGDVLQTDEATGNELVETDSAHEVSDMKDISENKYENQFMRIQVAASELKDVSHVQKDVNHGKRKLNRRASIMAGLERVVKGVEGERARLGPSNGDSSRSGVDGENRRADLAAGNDDRSKNTDRAMERERGNQIPGTFKRQGIGAMGRMLSKNRQKSTSVSGGAPRSGASQSSEQNSSSQTSLYQDSLPTLSSIDDETIDKQAKQHAMVGGATDRPRASEKIGNSGRGGRAGIAQVGRMLSRNRKKSIIQATERSAREAEGINENDNHLENRERPDNDVSKTRASLSRIGKMISFNRRHTAATGEEVGAETKASGSIDKKNLERRHASPLSTSTVSASSIGSPALGGPVKNAQDERDRGRNGVIGKKESRLGIRSAGRMFSLNRRSNVSSIGGNGTAEQKGQSVIGQEGEETEGCELDNGNHKTKTKKAEGGSGGGQKGDARPDKFVYSEVSSPAIAESGLLGTGGTEKQIRVPVIALAEFSDPLSREKWYVDGFTLPHNAVRQECIDLYEIMSALAHCNEDNDLCDDDINRFEEWWNVANGFFRCYFQMERHVLLPWVDSAGGQEWEVQLALKKMRSLKDKLENLLGKVDRVWNEKTFKTCGEMYVLIYKAVDDFVPRLMNYFVDQEVLLPAMVKEYYKKENRVEIDKQMVAAFMEEAQNHKDAPHHNLILLVRWISKSRQLRAWLGKNLSSSCRGMYPTWFQLYEDQHVSIFNRLRTRDGKTGVVHH